MPKDPAVRIAEIEGRTRCLEMAIRRAGANDPRPPLDIAAEFWTWVSSAKKPPKAKK